MLRCLEGFALDVRHAARSLVQRRGFTAAAVLTLALGTGASTAIFSIVYGVLLRPLPYAESDRLVVVHARYRFSGDVVASGFSAPDFFDFRDRLRHFEAVAYCDRNIFALDADAGFETVTGASVSSNLFAVLGVRPALGRAPSADAQEVVISDRLWRARFSADPQVVGRHVRLNALPYTIVGVAAPGMQFPADSRAKLGAPPETPDLWTPLQPDDWAASNRRYRGGHLVARMPRGWTLARASAEMAAAARDFGRVFPSWLEDIEPVVLPFADQITGAIRPALWMLLGAVGCVLLVACVNVANLLLARQTARARDLAVRVSLGAPRHRLIAHALAEALLLALVGGGLGVVLASWLVAVTRWLEPADLPRIDAIRIDLPVLAFAVGISTLAALLSAAAPAWRLLGTRARLLSGESRTCASSRGARRLRGALVVAELAISLVLLVGATLLVRSFARLAGTNIGVPTDHLIAVELNVAMARQLSPERQIRMADDLVAAVRALPGVVTAAAANGLPPNRTRMMVFIKTVDPRTGQPVERNLPFLNPTPGYFAAMRIPLLRGRAFTEADGADGPQVVIMNASAARLIFGTTDVVGRTTPPLTRKGVQATVVGVVGDVKYAGLAETAGPTLYLPFAQQPFRNMVLVARTADDPRSLAGSLARAIHKVDREVTVGAARTLEEVVSEAVARPRFRTALLSALAGLALLLAIVGLYGVAVYTVAQRTVEIGVRMALGAGRGQVIGMIVLEHAWLAAAGVGLGLGGAWLFTRTLSGFLYGVTAGDAGSFTLAAAVLVLVAVAASALAARRAARVDPVVALRAL